MQLQEKNWGFCRDNLEGTGSPINLTQRPLTEAPALSYGFIGCTKTEQGIKNIALLNKHLKVIKQTDAYINALSKWLPEHLKPLLKTRMN